LLNLSFLDQSDEVFEENTEQLIAFCEQSKTCAICPITKQLLKLLPELPANKREFLIVSNNGQVDLLRTGIDFAIVKKLGYETAISVN